MFFVRVEKSMKNKLEYIAKKESLSTADLARTLFHQYIKNFEKEKGEISEIDLQQISIDDVMKGDEKKDK